MAKDTWYIRYVDRETRSRIKSFASLYDIELAEALKRIVDLSGIAAHLEPKNTKTK